MDDLGILIKKNLKAASYNVQNFKSFVNNAYILLSAKLTEQKKNITGYRSSKNPIHLVGQLSSKIDQICARLP
jgi:hypothetical protein